MPTTGLRLWKYACYVLCWNAQLTLKKFKNGKFTA